MKPQKITITLVDSSDENVKVKVDIDPPIGKDDTEELEASPSVVALELMLNSLALMGEMDSPSESSRSLH